ncbi:MAG: hypothetical protein AAGE13_15935, partial [Pseudomonadota bacterium]
MRAWAAISVQAFSWVERLRADYGSRSRDAAAILTLAVEARSEVLDRRRLTRIALPRAGRLRSRSTQE